MEHNEQRPEHPQHAEQQKEAQMEQRIEAKIEQSASSKRDLTLPISILVAAVVIAGAVIFATLYKGGSPAAGGTGTQGTAGKGPSAATVASAMKLGARDAILGSANAPVTVIEYGDYQCPYCAQFFQSLQPQIVQSYVNTGKVKLVFRDFPFLGPESTAAAQAAQCAEDQNKLWAYHDALYSAKLADDTKGGGENDGSLNRTLFLKIASQLNLDGAAFTSCLDKNAEANAVAQQKSVATSAGVNSTPTTFVNGVMVADPSGNSVGADGTAILNAIGAAVASAK